jgi:hypothetical protein
MTSLVATNLLRLRMMADNSAHGPQPSKSFSAARDAVALSGRMIVALVGTWNSFLSSAALLSSEQLALWIADCNAPRLRVPG